MPPSLRFLATLVCFSTSCGVASLLIVEHQDTVRTRVTAEQLTGGTVEAGKRALQRNGCGACHQIHGVEGADGRVGPSLNGVALRAEIAGQLVNRPRDMVRWIRHPQQVAPGNGMPDLSISEFDARDMAAYLYTLKSTL